MKVPNLKTNDVLSIHYMAAFCRQLRGSMTQRKFSLMLGVTQVHVSACEKAKSYPGMMVFWDMLAYSEMDNEDKLRGLFGLMRLRGDMRRKAMGGVILFDEAMEYLEDLLEKAIANGDTAEQWRIEKMIDDLMKEEFL